MITLSFSFLSFHRFLENHFGHKLLIFIQLLLVTSKHLLFNHFSFSLLSLSWLGGSLSLISSLLFNRTSILILRSSSDLVSPLMDKIVTLSFSVISTSLLVLPSVLVLISLAMVFLFILRILGRLNCVVQRFVLS